MSFRITGLDPTAFKPFFGMSDDELRARGARRVVADQCPGYPDRIELRDAMPGENLILLNYTHQPADSPYRASHAVYVLEHSRERFDKVDEVPEVLRSRMISLRAFNDDGMIVGAELCSGADLEEWIGNLFQDASASYIHLHYAKYGCYACRVDRIVR